jgi:alkylhydroperoxidase family enzyme
MNQLDRNLGTEPLVPLVADEDFTPAYAAAMDEVRAHTGMVSNSARSSAHAEEIGIATRKYLAQTWTLGDLAKPFRALIRYKVATANTCFYCSTHQIAYLQKFGFDRDKIANIHEFETHPAFDERERAALAFVDAMTRDAANIPDRVARRFVRTFTPKERVEIAIVGAAMGMLNKLNDALRIPIEESAIEVGAEVPDFGLTRTPQA